MDRPYDLVAKVNPLTSHREQKEMLGYVLTVATSPKDPGTFHPRPRMARFTAGTLPAAPLRGISR
jgi:hypothetical protein